MRLLPFYGDWCLLLAVVIGATDQTAIADSVVAFDGSRNIQRPSE